MNRSALIPLDLNESYWLLDDVLAEKILKLDIEDVSTYPDYTELKTALARYVGAGVENITLTAGSDEAIEHIARMCGRSRRALLPIPTFSGYEMIFNRAGVAYETVCYTELDGFFHFPLEETLRRMESGGIGALFLCQPNNPLGTAIDKPAMQALLKAAKEKDVLMIVDEAYGEFTGSTMVPQIGEQPLIILKTFSKAFGLAGARVGYCVSNAGITAELAGSILPWPVSHPSVRMALSALSEQASFIERRRVLNLERERFIDGLSLIDGIVVYPSLCNFILARVNNAREVQKEMLRRGIKVALGESKTLDRNAKALLFNTIRMSVPAPGDREKVLQALQESHSLQNKEAVI